MPKKSDLTQFGWTTATVVLLSFTQPQATKNEIINVITVVPLVPKFSGDYYTAAS